MTCDVERYTDIDIDKHPYVAPYSYPVETKYGRSWILKATISDGATGVRDLAKEAFTWHDVTYKTGVLFVSHLPGSFAYVPVSKTYCDFVYARMLFRSHHYAAWLRGLGLCNPLSWHIWQDNREDPRAPEKILEDMRLPDPEAWDFHGWDITRAVYRGRILTPCQDTPCPT
jgi:hypothetical protein